jgi:hypothetical protein
VNRRHVLRALAVVGLYACDDAKPQRKRGPDDEDDQKRRPRGSQPSVGGAAPPLEPFKFGADLDAGIALAAREKRPLLVFFSAEWNIPCKEQQKVFETADFRNAAGGFVGVLVDVTNDDAKAQKAMLEHKVTGVPAVLVADSTGKVVHRVQTLEPLDKWLERLAQVK